MTDWKVVTGSQAEKPAEWDTTSSASTVYQRRNVEQIEVGQTDGTTVQLWQYEERTMTAEEMHTVRFADMEANQAAIMAALADIYAQQIGG